MRRKKERSKQGQTNKQGKATQHTQGSHFPRKNELPRDTCTSFREQNSINWKINEDICRRAVAEYKCKWSKKEGVDIRVLNEWEHKMNECIRRRIQLLREKHIYRRKQHVLKSRKHLNYLHELQSKYVLVPADKAANNIIVVCKKYYLEVVLKELRTTSTYKHVDRECMDVVTEHLKFIPSTKYT